MIEILVLLLLISINGLFAMSEIALVSSRRRKLMLKAKKGSYGAAVALELLKEPEQFLSTVQIGITLVGIISGVYGGAAFAEDLIPYFQKITWIGDYAIEVAFVVVVAGIAYFSLIIGELVPKSIAMNNPERITVALAPFMKGVAKLTYPLVFLLSISTKILLRILMIKQKKEPPITEEELKYLIDTGSQHGVIEQQEGEMMKRIFAFGDRHASLVMTHRNDIVWLDIHASPEDIARVVRNSSHTKLPVCEGSLDKILGFIASKDVLFRPEVPLKNKLTEPLFIPRTMTALRVLDLFRRKRIHMGFVVDEKRGTEGLITLHDLIENILGELPELSDG